MSTPAADGHPPRATRIGWPLLLVLASLAAVAPVATDLYLPGFPAMGAELGADASGVQLTLTSFLAGLAFGRLVMGPVSDRYGRRRPLVVSAALCVVAGVVCAVAPTLEILVAARLVQGFTGAGGMVIGRAAIADVVTGRAPAKAVTLKMTVGGVAPVLAPLVGGLLAGPVGWRGMLWAVAALCAAMLAGVLVVVWETRPAEVRAESSAPWQAAMRIVLGTRDFRAPVAVFALSFAVMMAYISPSPFRVPERRWAVGGRVRRPVRSQRRRADRSGSGRRPDGGPGRPAASAASVIVGPGGRRGGVPGSRGGRGTRLELPAADLRRCLGQRRDHGQRCRAGHGTGPCDGRHGSAVLGFARFAPGAVVSPLVGLGGEDPAVVPALVMTCASVLGCTLCWLRVSR